MIPRQIAEARTKFHSKSGASVEALYNSLNENYHWAESIGQFASTKQLEDRLAEIETAVFTIERAGEYTPGSTDMVPVPEEDALPVTESLTNASHLEGGAMGEGIPGDLEIETAPKIDGGKPSLVPDLLDLGQHDEL